jgi:hypothetical protein
LRSVDQTKKSIGLEFETYERNGAAVVSNDLSGEVAKRDVRSERHASPGGDVTQTELRSNVPAVDGCAVVELIEAQVGRGHHLRQHDDLPGVHREVFCYVKDCLEDVDV